MQPLLRVQMRAGYGKRCVLEEIAFTLARGERMGLVGTSGEGKSTLVMALLGLLAWRGGWAEGEVQLDCGGEATVNLLGMKERDARKVRGRHVALVPQSPMSALNGAVSLRKHFEEAWRAHETSLGTAFEARVRELMRRVRLPEDSEFLRRKPDQVSAGQAQRAVLAMALLHRPALLIADEPTSSLDACTQLEVLDLLRDVNGSEGTAVLYISHDLLSVLQFCERLAVLSGGRLVEDVATAALADGEHHVATETLLRTLPVPVATLLAHAHRSQP